MEIAYEAQTWTGDAAGTETTLSSSLTTSGSNRLLIVAARSGSGTEQISSVTYGGQALTKITAFDLGGAAPKYDIWYKINPLIGENNIVATRTASGSIWFFSATQYSGVFQDSFPNASGTNTTTGTSINKTITSTVDNCWGIALSGTDSGGVLTEDENLTFRTSQSYQLPLGDTNGVISPAGNITMGFNCSASKVLGIYVATIAPAPDIPSGNPAFFTGGGLTIL